MVFKHIEAKIESKKTKCPHDYWNDIHHDDDLPASVLTMYGNFVKINNKHPDGMVWIK